MNRRSFLTGLGAVVGGIAIEQAIPFNRVWSFPKDPDELFPAYLKSVYARLESFVNAGQHAPSPENIEWAKKVLLRVLPRHYLIAAEIDHFDREIHVNWEHGNKRVTVFLPGPNLVKIYCEKATDQGTEHHLSPQADNPWEIRGVLRWLFSPDA